MMIVMNVTGVVGGGIGPALWLSENPTEGSVPADGLQPVVVTFDANKVNAPGTYIGLSHSQQQRPAEPGHRRTNYDGGYGTCKLGCPERHHQQSGLLRCRPRSIEWSNRARHRIERHDPHSDDWYEW